MNIGRFVGAALGAKHAWMSGREPQGVRNNLECAAPPDSNGEVPMIRTHQLPVCLAVCMALTSSTLPPQQQPAPPPSAHARYAAGSRAGPAEPRVELLWPDGAPGVVGNEDTDRPALTIDLPTMKAAGTGVVVCPGGGYAHLAMDHEGIQVARWLTSLGVAAFVLKYRLGPRYHYPAQLQDAQRALRSSAFTPRISAWLPTGSGFGGFRRADTWPQPQGLTWMPASPKLRIRSIE